MDFRVGGTPPVVGDAAERSETPTGQVEARVLAVRSARHRTREHPGGERREQPRRSLDPRGARVLLLMIPQGYRLPAGLADGSYRIFLRFVKK